MVCLQNKRHALVSVANWGGRLLRPAKTVIDRCVNVPARDAPGRNGRSWGSHMNPPLNSCINVGLSGRWAHDAHVWFFRTCSMRLDDAVGDLLTSCGRIQVCVWVCTVWIDVKLRPYIIWYIFLFMAGGRGISSCGLCQRSSTLEIR